jgi:putative ABC transport system permease protein
VKKERRVYFGALVVQNVTSRKVRSTLTAVAVSVSIATVVTMGVLTYSLRRTAISILRTGTADFTIAQEDVSDVLYSSIDERDMESIRELDGVESAIGVLVAPHDLDADHPFFLRIGIGPDHLEAFGVKVVEGRAYEATAENEIMLGFRAARKFDKHVGDHFILSEDDHVVVGIYSTGEVFGDSGSMLPLIWLQAQQRKPGTVTLGFVRVEPGTDIDALRATIERDYPQLATVKTESEFGRIDRNLELLSAANTGVSMLALVIGAVTILNMMVISIFERTREFGVLRAIGWSRVRVLAEVMMEALIIAMIGAVVGIVAGFVVIRLLADTAALRGVFDPQYESGIFTRALAIAFGMAFFGALYPALRAAFLRPLTAIRHE